MRIGSHVSIAKGYHKAALSALEMGANTFQFFTRNPRGASIKAFDSKDVKKLEAILKENMLGSLLAHAPYTMNLASSNETTRSFAKQVLKEDLERLELLPCSLYNLHPGSHTGLGKELGINHIANALNEVIKEEMTSSILLETMSGKGTEIGSSFVELKQILDRVNYNEKVGICMDTCHLFSAGYDLVNHLEDVLAEFDQVIGLNKLHAIHLNDSMLEFNSRKDRHAGIGKGKIGLEALVNFLQHPSIQSLPIFLETPVSLEEHAEEISLLKKHILLDKKEAES